MGEAGRRVRCAACGHAWTAKPVDPLEPAAGVAPPDAETGLTRMQVERLRQTASRNAATKSGPHAEIRAKERERRAKNRKIAAGIAWMGGFLVFAGMSTGALMNREQVVKTWPKTASFYSLAGFEINRFGVELVNVSAERSFDGTIPILTVTGAAQNVTDQPQTAPRIRVALRDESGEEVKVWTASLDVASIPAGGQAAFRSRIDAPPLEAFNLNASLLDPPPQIDAPTPTPTQVSGDGQSFDDQPEGDAVQPAVSGHGETEHANAGH